MISPVNKVHSAFSWSARAKASANQLVAEQPPALAAVSSLLPQKTQQFVVFDTIAHIL
jgi:hypothetical protein